MKVTKEFVFDSAHFLPNYNGKCERLHGDTYKMHVTVEAPVEPKSGMALDFGELKRITQEHVISKLDHHLIYDIIPNSSAEYIAIWSWNQLREHIPLYKIKLWETPTSFVTYQGEQEDLSGMEEGRGKQPAK